ncbi:STAS domain-containing protein [Acidobacteria bacterium ACD]|nr:MAG: STAS domain-containing protein [Acidobacteriota bacterium]MDL1948474.1 STAS domain-containing protein [Acidobacteria bacterium ACD]
MPDPKTETRWPVLDWFRGYRREWLAPDAIAGVTSAAVVVPKALAFATIAGLPLQAGLATAFVPAVLYALLGGSRPMSISTTSTIAILAGTQVAQLAPEGSGVAPLAVAATLSVLVGAVLLAARLLRLGAVADLISDPVLTGFKAGIGIVIVVDQLPKLLGIHIAKAGFFRDAVSVVRTLPETSLPTLLVGGGLLAAMFLLEHFAPKLPAPLLVVAAGIGASSVLGLAARSVATVGEVPAGFPPFTPPLGTLAEELWPGAVGIALMSFIETIAVGRAFREKGEANPDPDRELFALGAANVAGGFLGCMPAGGGTSQTAVSRRAGARTQLCGSVAALGALATLLFLAPLLGLMPSAALAAVVVATSIPLIRPADFRALAKVRRTELIWAFAATAGVVLLGTLKGILVAVLVSLVALAAQSMKPSVFPVGRKPGTDVFRRLSPDHPEDETFPGVLLARIIGRLYFVNVKRAGEDLRRLVEEAEPRVVVLDCSALIDLEYTALKTLIEAEESSRAQGILLCLAALNPDVREMVERSSLGATLGRERMFFNLEQAVGQLPSLLERATGAATTGRR